MPLKKMLRLFFSLALSAFFLWLAFRNVNTAKVAEALRTVQPAYVCAYLATLILVQVFRAVRWHILVRPFANVGPKVSWRISNVGTMLIMLLPLRLGEFARPYLMKKQCGVSFTSTMGAVAVERVVDGLLVTVLFFATTATLGPPYEVAPALKVGAWAALAVFAGATLVLVTALLTGDLVPSLIRRVAGRVAPHLTDKALELLDAFVRGLRSLPDVRASMTVVLYTLAYWAANALGLYWLMCAFGWDLPLVAGFVLVCVMVIGIMIPAGPGFLGTYQSALVAGLGVFNIARDPALAYTVIAYPLNLGVVVLFGLPYLFGQGGLHVSDMVQDSENSDPQKVNRLQAPGGQASGKH